MLEQVVSCRLECPRRPYGGELLGSRSYPLYPVSSGIDRYRVQLSVRTQSRTGRPDDDVPGSEHRGSYLDAALSHVAWPVDGLLKVRLAHLLHGRYATDQILHVEFPW